METMRERFCRIASDLRRSIQGRPRNGDIRLLHNLDVSISLFPAIFAAVLFGPLAGMVVYAASAIALELPLAGRVTYFFNRALIGAVGGLFGQYAAWIRAFVDTLRK